MTRVAFYAPMKPPTHKVPSGDREMARNMMTLIGRNAKVTLASQLRVHDAKGDASFQSSAMAAATDEVNRLVGAPENKDLSLWVTYHNYYKAPDLIGPAVCQALNLPYVLIEASRARSRLQGPWSQFAAAAEAASDAADVIFYLTQRDRITLERDRANNQKLVHLRPFLAADTLPPQASLHPEGRTGAMVSVGMMREGDKLASYRIIADTLGHLPGDWRLEIAGDGPARGKVSALMARFGRRVTFLGQLDKPALAQAFRRASLFFWPGVNEAWGMVYLEAQAAGLPVVAQDRPGVRDVVLAGHLTAPQEGPEALADVLTSLLNSPEKRQTTGRTARQKIAKNHLIPAAADTFLAAVTPLIKARI